MELTAKQKEWQPHLEAIESFDGTAADYARLHGLNLKQLYFYRSAIARRTNTAQFVRVKSSTAELAGVHVQLPNGVRLVLPSLAEPGLLERLAAL